MTLPITTTTITIQRPSAGVDPYEDQSVTTVATAIPAVISGSSGSGSDVGGTQEVVQATLFVNQGVDVQRADTIVDAISGDTWRVLWTRARYELGLGHVKAGLEYVSGANDG